MTGIRTRPATQEYRDNWDRIFRPEESPARSGQAEGGPGITANSRPDGRGSAHPLSSPPEAP